VPTRHPHTPPIPGATIAAPRPRRHRPCAGTASHAIAECFVGSIRRELLDGILIINQQLAPAAPGSRPAASLRRLPQARQARTGFDAVTGLVNCFTSISRSREVCRVPGTHNLHRATRAVPPDHHARPKVRRLHIALNIALQPRILDLDRLVRRVTGGRRRPRPVRRRRREVARVLRRTLRADRDVCELAGRGRHR
jgi:hypothetical protein